MSRFAFAVLTLTIFAGLTSAMTSEARAAGKACDAAACIAKYCSRAIAGNAQRCNSNCQITVAENQKKGLCK